jgi:hypothetical protein
MGALIARSNNNLLLGHLPPATLSRLGYRGAVVLLHLNSGRFVEGTTVLCIAAPVGRCGCVWWDMRRGGLDRTRRYRNRPLCRSHKGRVTRHVISLTSSRQAWARQLVGIDTGGERPVHLNQKRRITGPWLENLVSHLSAVSVAHAGKLRRPGLDT